MGLVLCAACARGPGAEHDPRPLRLVPSVGINKTPVRVAIEGENFQALTTQHLGGERPLEVDSRFEARLGDTPLEDVVLEADGRLRAVVPQGLPPGLHALTLVSPLGRGVVLPDAYLSLEHAPAQLAASAVLEPSEVGVGQEARLILTVTNLGETQARDVKPTFDISERGRVTVVAEPKAGDVEAKQQRSFTWVLRAEAPGMLSLVALAHGKDAVQQHTVSASAASVSLSARTPARLEAPASSLSAGQLSLGQEVEVQLKVHNVGETLARGVTPVAGVERGASLLTAPAPVDIPGGEVHTFLWRYRTDAAGPVTFTLSAAGTEALGGQPVRVGPLAAPQLTVQRPAGLAATLEAPAQASVGQPVTVSLRVTNTGEATARDVTPVLVLPASLEVLSAPLSENIAGGQERTFTWSVRAKVAGEVLLEGKASGTDANSVAQVDASAVQHSLTVQSPAALLATLEATPAQVHEGGTVTLSLKVRNTGQALASTVVPSAPVVTGAATPVSGPTPASLDLVGGAEGVFSWRYKADAAGTLTFRASATGREGNSGVVLTAPEVEAGPLLVQRPAALVGRMVGPVQLTVGQVITRSLEVRNTGTTTARAVRVTVQGNAGAEHVRLLTAPSPASADIAGGASHTFSWTVEGVSEGTVHATVSASGTDALDGRVVGTGALNTVLEVQRRASEVAQLAANPFGDGTAFSFVFRYNDRVYLGPNRAGTGGVHMLPDGSDPQAFTWRLPADTSGNRTQNAAPPMYRSIGAPGCVKDTQGCGPDNENGRGLFFAGVMGGQEWLGVAGANSAGDLDYVYLTQERDADLDFRFVDLDAAPLGGQTKGTSSALFFKDRLYLGFPDTGGSRPYLVVLKTLPSVAPGLDAVQGLDAESLEAEKMPGLGQGGSPSNPAAMQMIDAMVAFNDRLYVANNGGCVRSTTPTPRPYGKAPGDWAPCTPALAAWTQRPSRTTLKTADLEPADKAVPRMAVFGGRLYLARNTTGGPQLFACTPGRSGDAGACDPGDWVLVAANARTERDGLLTQFDNPNNTAVALLVATANHLYVGFNNAVDGLVLLRSEGANPATTADFRGSGACSAAQHPGGCAGLGGNGLGPAKATRLFDGVALTFGAADFVYITAGDGSGAMRVFRVAD